MQNELYIVADAIKALRESRGLTQEQLAEKADISVSHLAKIETHARAMGMKTYIRLLEAMAIPIKEHFINFQFANLSQIYTWSKKTLYTHKKKKKRYDAERKNLVSGTGL